MEQPAVKEIQISSMIHRWCCKIESEMNEMCKQLTPSKDSSWSN